MRISESKIRSLIREAVTRLTEDQDKVYLALFNSLDTLSQLISKTKPDEIERKALSLFKNNAGREPENESDSFADAEGKNISLTQLKSALATQYEKDVENFISSTLPLDQDLVTKYIAFAKNIIDEQPYTSAEEIAKQMGEMIRQDYSSLGGGGVNPRKGSAVGIDRSLKAAWKEASSEYPEFWSSFQTWSNIDYSGKSEEDLNWLDTFMRQMEIRLSDRQPLSCVGAPAPTGRMPRELKRMLSGMPGKIHVQIDGNIEFASKTDANTQHTRKYDPDTEVKEKSVDLTFISADKGAGDNMLIGVPGEPISDGLYNEIIVGDWAPGAGLVLPVRDVFDQIRDTITFFNAMYPAFQEFNKRNPNVKNDPKFSEFKNDVKSQRESIPVYGAFIDAISNISGVEPDHWLFFALALDPSKALFFPGDLFRNGSNLAPERKYFYNYLINHVTHLYDAGFNLFPTQELENYKALLKYFYKL